MMFRPNETDIPEGSGSSGALRHADRRHRHEKVGHPGTPGITGIHPDVRSVNPGAVKRWHRAGFKVRPYTVDDKRLLLWQALCGVDAVFTNKPLESAAFLAAVCKKTCMAEDQVR